MPEEGAGEALEVRLVVGLGNPGRRYENTWHNLGRRVVGELAQRWKVQFIASRGDYQAAERRMGGRVVTLMAPDSYMNRSGVPVVGWVRRHRIAPEQVLVVSDDHDLPWGRIRIRSSGSSGGHKGLDSLIAELGTDRFPRVRVGIATGDESGDLREWVLSEIPVSRAGQVVQVVEMAADAVETVLTRGIGAAMTMFNGRLAFADEDGGLSAK